MLLHKLWNCYKTNKLWSWTLVCIKILTSNDQLNKVRRSPRYRQEYFEGIWARVIQMIKTQAFRYDGKTSRRDVVYELVFHRIRAKINFALISTVHLNIYKMINSRIN